MSGVGTRCPRGPGEEEPVAFRAAPSGEGLRDAAWLPPRKAGKKD